jgi:hypothetical protein
LGPSQAIAVTAWHRRFHIWKISTSHKYSAKSAYEGLWDQHNLALGTVQMPVLPLAGGTQHVLDC